MNKQLKSPPLSDYFAFPSTLCTAFTTCCACGTASASRLNAYGIGTSTPHNLSSGASR